MINPLTKDEVKNAALQILDNVDIIHPYPEWAFNPAKKDWKKFFESFVMNLINKRETK